MVQKGKFILLNINEFENWLMSSHYNRRITLIQNHHTYIPNYSHFNGINHFSMAKGMENSHILRGFAEIAQNITTFPDGSLMICRSFEKIPAGIKGANQSGICIEHVGCFDIGADIMSQEHKRTILKLNALLCRKFGLIPNTDSIVYHHWYDLITGKRRNGLGNTKSCPGTNFFGGNSLIDAQSVFIPLVLEEYQNFALELTPPIPIKSVVVTASRLNVRLEPNVSSAIVRSLSEGLTLNVYEIYNGWYKIHPTQQNWVNSLYVQ